MSKGSILVVDDEERQREIYRDILQDEGYETVTMPSGEDALRLLAQKRFDLVLTDLNLTGMTGIELLTEILRADPTIAIILITGYPSIESAIEATRRGVYQYLEKPVDRAKLLEAVRGVFEHLDALKQSILGHSAAVREMIRMILKVAPTSHTVLILGESGTGKELVAREIHHHSPRRHQPFLAVNCASLTETLLESELFGHEKGAFTDAHQQKRGLFERANRSTLFLDEIGETSLGMQAKILRALQEKEILRVGGTETIKVDVRIIAATNRNLDQLLREGKFREDLYYRLKVIPLICPPLRERREDIEELSLHFMRRAARIADRQVLCIASDALATLKNYDWPGNIRQLEMAIERAVVLGDASSISLRDLPPEILGGSTPTHDAERRTSSAFTPQSSPDPVISEGSWEEHEKAKIMEALERTNWNITRAAQLLGMTFRTLQYRLDKFSIRKP